MIYEEFKGTGNMEVFLDRKLSEKRIFPAIDLNKSGTRREELLLESRELDAVWTIRKAFGQLDTSAVTEMIINLLLKTKDNAQFISSVNISMNDKTLFDAMRGQNLTSQPGAGRSMAYTSTNGYSSNGYNAGNRKEPDDA
jgi:transcription termination factor Rho